MKNIFKAVGIITAVLFCYRLYFYISNNWFSNPTILGTFLLLGFFIASLITLGIGFEYIALSDGVKARITSRIPLIKSIHGKIGISVAFMGMLVFFIINTGIKCSLNSILCGNLDILIGFNAITVLFCFPEIVNKNSLIYLVISNIGDFISRYFIVLLLITHIIIKAIYIIPNAYALVFPADAIQYFSLARQFSEGNPDFVAYHHYPPLYSLILAPSFLLNYKETLQVIALINIIISSTSLIPINLISRVYLNHRLAGLITVIAALFPYHFVYPFFPASENLYYPLFFWIIFLLVRIPKPNKYEWWIDVCLGLLIGLAYLTRYQTLPLIPAYLLCYWLKPDINHPDRVTIRPNTGKVIRSILVLSGVIIPVAAWLISGSLQGVNIKNLLGLTVEGNASILKINPEPEAFYLWLYITIAYFILILGPSTVFLLSFPWKKSAQLDAKTQYWLILFTITFAVFFIIVFRHAWIASYNVDGPNKLLGRYSIYLSILSWITSIILLETGKNISWKRLFIFSIPAYSLIIGAYALFHDRDWIFDKPIIHFIYLDGHISGFQPLVYFSLLTLLILFIVIMMKIKQKRLLSPVFLVMVGISNLTSLPFFYSEIIKLERPGRFLAEMDRQILSLQSVDQNRNDNFVLSFYDMFILPEDHLKTRNIDLNSIDIRTITKEELLVSPRNYFSELIVNGKEEYQIIKKSDLLSSDQMISEFRFNGADFLLVKVLSQ